MIRTLHLLNKPPEHSRFRLCLSAIGPEDALLMTENAVLAVARPSRLAACQWFALGPDLEARGLISTISADQVVSFDDMVTLVASAENVISW